MNLLLALAVILIGARLGGHLASRLRQPPVLGELLFGIVLGNLALAGIPWFESIPADPAIAVLAELGVLILLFEVGLESTVQEALQVGVSSALVAVLGVIAPFALGWGVGALLLPDRSAYVHAFLGATLTATSVGITARVFKDLGRSGSREARVILGAAVIDDVLGLVILAVVGGIISAADTGQQFTVGATAVIVLKALVFLVGALMGGMLVSPQIFGFAAQIEGRGVLLGFALAFCFALAWAASLLGLAPIVGAYAAGLVLEKAHYEGFGRRGEPALDHLIAPIGSFLVPVFFVVMGMRVDLTAFGRPGVLGLAALLSVAAILGKQVCALGVVGEKLDRLVIGLGMIPRGEVGLIFANVGLGLAVAGERIVDDAIYSAVVIMVVVTTLVTPPLLSWRLRR